MRERKRARERERWRAREMERERERGKLREGKDTPSFNISTAPLIIKPLGEKKVRQRQKTTEE
jgi:hypothetical protein